MEPDDKSGQLYMLMIHKGYPEAFSRIIAGEMRTDFTAGRMLEYISRNKKLPLEEVADEMFAIFDMRDRTVERHINLHAEQSVNDWYRNYNDKDED